MRIGDDPRLTDGRVKEWFLLEKARRERDAARGSVRNEPLPVITISRQYGAGGTTVAGKLRELLDADWVIWDRELIEAVATSADGRKEMVETLDEHVVSWMTQMIRNLFGVRAMDSHAYRHHLAQVLLALAHQGRKIIVGRGANFVLPAALNIRLEAALEFRVQTTMARLGLNHEAALDLVLRSDRERADFSRGVFDRDVEDRAAYDVVLQTDSLGHDTAAAMIACGARAIFGDKIKA